MDREQTTIRLPKKLMDSLKKEAEEKGLSLNAYILTIWKGDKKMESLRPIEFIIRVTNGNMTDALAMVEMVKKNHPDAKITVEVVA